MLCVAVCSFLLLYSITLYEYRTAYLSIVMLMGIYIILGFE